MTSTMPAAARSVGAETLRVLWKRLRTEGFVVTTDNELGIARAVREHIHGTYFTADHLRRYEFDIPADRERARDVVRYAWTGEPEPELAEHHTIAIDSRGDQPLRREFERVRLLDDPLWHRWISTVLSLVPPAARQRRGTFGVNLFRTHTDVVTRPHRDYEEYVLIHVLERHGTGAETVLYGKDSDHVVLRRTLEPGDLVIFRDEDFRHTATPLIDPSAGPAHRDAVVCTVNYAHTYPLD